MLKSIIHPILKRNYVFKDIFSDQTCYIFGNGSSLKYVDFKHFNDHPTIGINHLVLHKDFNLLDTCCYTLPEPFSFYYYFKNPYKLKYEKNIMGNLFKDQFSRYHSIPLFTSFTNMFGARFKNTFFLHHFGNRKPNSQYLDICSEFSYLAGGLYSGIGLAIAFGFKKAILVGCDYLMKPKTYGHFYSQPKTAEDLGLHPYEELLEDCSNLIDLEAISINSSDCWIPAIDYKTHTGTSPKYRENNEIVSKKNLLVLNEAYEIGQYPLAILPKDFN